MRVLVASVFSPTPPLGGGEVQLLGVLRALRHLHEVHVVCYGQSVDVEGVGSTVLPPPTHHSGWRRRARLVASLLGGDPPTAASFASGGLVAATRELAASGRFDVVHVTHFEAGFLGRELDGQPRVFVPIDTWSLNEWERARATHAVPRLRDRIRRVGIERFERTSLRSFPVTVVVSEADRQALRALVPSADVRVIPNGVDIEWFAPIAAGVPPPPPVVVFHGSLHYEPNVDAATFLVREVMPLVRERIGPVDVRLVGRRPVPEVLALAAPDVVVHADVPDLRPLVGGATAAVIPLRYGSGVKNKVLEAVALGVPTVVTPEAVAGLDLADGGEVLVASGADRLADAIVRVLTDETLRGRLATGGRRAVVERWSWDVAARAFSRVYEDVAAASERP